MTTKKVVRYTHVMQPLVIGQSALVWPVDHPSPDVSNQRYARTSAVVKASEHGTWFETENTMYYQTVSSILGL